MTNRITVHADWDPEAGVYVATSDDVVGLVTEAESYDALRRKLPAMVRDLVELNNLSPVLADAPIDILMSDPRCPATLAS